MRRVEIERMRKEKLSIARKLTESLRAKNRKFKESADSVYDWFQDEWMDLDVYTGKLSEVLNGFDESDYTGLTKALKTAFKPTDKVNYIFSDDQELEDLQDLLWSEDKKPEVFQDAYIFNVDTGNVKDEPVVFATDGYGSYCVVVGY